MIAAKSPSPFLLGCRDGLPFLVVVLPFGMLFGVVATEAGLGLAETMGFSIVVVAGASQFAAVSLMEEGAPTLAVLATALAVNLRMAMYSAALVPYLGQAPAWQRAVAAYVLVDQTYAVSVARYEQNPDWPAGARIAYFFGAAMFVVPLWYAFTLLGALVGSAVPPWLALDFALPVCFLALVAPMLRTIAHVAAAVVSCIAALALAGMPAGTGLLLAAVLAMVTGAAVETWTERRAQ